MWKLVTQVYPICSIITQFRLYGVQNQGVNICVLWISVTNISLHLKMYENRHCERDYWTCRKFRKMPYVWHVKNLLENFLHIVVSTYLYASGMFGTFSPPLTFKETAS